jgi:hypothetical protein
LGKKKKRKKKFVKKVKEAVGEEYVSQEFPDFLNIDWGMRW